MIGDIPNAAEWLTLRWGVVGKQVATRRRLVRYSRRFTSFSVIDRSLHIYQVKGRVVLSRVRQIAEFGVVSVLCRLTE